MVAKSNKVLIGFMLAVAAAVIIANLSGKETTILVSNLIYIPVAGGLVVIASINSFRHKLKGIHGKSWFFFFLAAASWFVAEVTWIVYELVLGLDPFPSEADYFYLLGYPLYFVFAMMYLKPVIGALSKKMIAGGIGAGVMLLVPTLFFVFDGEYEATSEELFWALVYPVVDSIVLVPAAFSVALFFEGKVNFMWSLSLIGILCLVAADAGFMFLQFGDSYYTGHPVEIIFYWMYLLFAAGVYDHMKLFTKQRKEAPEKWDADSLR